MKASSMSSFEVNSYSSSFHLLVFIFLLILNFPSLKTPLAATLNETDKLALQAFREYTIQDPSGIISSWNESINHCQWMGITCSTRHEGRVTELNLNNQQLVASIPPHIGNLSFLRYINLGSNRFRGNIPPEIGRLSRLVNLNLSNNEIGGEIPRNLSSCSSLQVINLMYNRLEGIIPDEIGKLSSKLTRFSVSVNNLTGNIPQWLANASSLTRLSMAGNNFQGQIPAELGRLSKLILFQFSGNNLSGTVPPSIFNLSSLLYLDVGTNQLQGTIPSDIGYTLPNLLGLYVYENQFSGPIPASLANAKGLFDISFGFNSFTGTLPLSIGSLKDLARLSLTNNQLENNETEGLSFLTSLTNCSNLRVLDLGGNKFKGQLPASIGNFSTNLASLIIGTNQISGRIPESIENLIGLSLLALYKNNITGVIPAGIGKLEKLEELRLYSNRLSGKIPSSFGNNTRLLRLGLHENLLEGNIPSTLGNIRNLQALSLSANNLSGVIPKEVVSISSLSAVLDLSRNSLTGPLPPEIGNLTGLTQIDISHNKLSGEIPRTIDNCIMLEVISFQDNLFEGSISSSLSALRSLHFLDLSNNNFSGEIPQFLQNLTLLGNLNLSSNHLEGEVPLGGVFSNVSAVSVAGNSRLCGGIRSLSLPECEAQGRNKHQRSLVLKIVIPVIASCSILAACFLDVFAWKRKVGKKAPATLLQIEEHFPTISYAELKHATDDFSPSNLVGEGSYGSVYKGILDGDGTVVAVKVINLKHKGASKVFMAECEALRSIRHRNLIKIMTICSSIDFKGADFKAIVCEYMQNGSLEVWLHQNEEKTDMRTLSLVQRLNIAIDVAFAIEYLHYDCETSIVHGDLKPSNVLLDHDMTAHVADFGLARFLRNGPEDANSSAKQTISIGIKGTVGYVAPEYGMGSEASMAGDVYSYGILLLEMFTGKRPTDAMFNNGLNLHEHSKMALPERVIEIAEPSLLVEGAVDENSNYRSRRDRERGTRIKECLVAVMKIGILCSVESPVERMEMRDVGPELGAIKKKLLGSST
ncbi:LRR receptor-like serine/threonine-protein kinase [Tripterygium wilfordii]|uniref:non-specific serine/threonine protein kinase n=1 Tax=Tripterygium wilfordii TaxID=458696 RepID=A0A7J7C086_TRIWF|nr:putative receptor-like protein kinase At3g47110 [Tripterygium wilfordii]KAF5727335.1 LRR receptor-like serine/threonine-protein kinase [Tripterygium wilfordii]